MKNSNILDANKIPSKIIEIIQNSTEYCFLVTAYFQTWNILDRELEKAANQNKKIVFILRDNSKNREYEYLNSQYGFDIIYVENLHTKLYFNESEALISSMNLYKYSTENNYELGYYFSGRQYSKDFLDTVINGDILLSKPFIMQGLYFNNYKDPQPQRQNISYRQQQFSKNNAQMNGFCIRCGADIPLDPNRPLCDECFSTWVQYSNPCWIERFCHVCGNEIMNSFGNYNLCYENPVCPNCKRILRSFR